MNSRRGHQPVPSRVCRALVRSLVVVLATASALVAVHDTAHAVDYRLEILNGTFNGRPGDQLFFNLAVPANAEIEALLSDPTATLVARISAPLVSRDAAVAAARGDEFIADAELALGADALRRITVDATPAFQVLVPTSSRNARNRLVVARDGVRALNVTVTGANGLVAELRTFVNLVTNRNFTPLPITTVAWLDTPPTIAPDGNVTLRDETREQLRDLRDLLARSPQGVQLGVRLQPELLDGLSRSTDTADQELLSQLLPLLAGNDLLVSTFRSSNVPSYAAAQLRAQFEAQLVRGETTLDAVNGAALPSRAVWLTNEPLDAASVDFVRGFGVTNVVMVGSAVQAYGPETNQNRSYALSSPTAGVVLNLADQRYSTLLDEPTGTAHESAAALAAELIAHRNEVAASFVGPAALNNRHVVLSSATGVPREPLIAALTLRYLRSAPQISFVPVTDLAPTLEGLPTITPPQVSLIDVAQIQASTNAARESIAAISDALQEADGVVTRWIELLDIANDTSLTDEQRQTYLGTVLDGVAGVRNAVTVPRNSYTFGSRESQLRIALTNASDHPLTLQLRLASAANKMTFTPDVLDVQIAARGQRELFVDAVARSNGLLTVELVLTTPSGVVLDSQTVRVRVNAIAGLGRGVSVVFLALLVLWWLIHLRRSHRKKKTRQHPALRSSP